jgi:hypothetical protein
MKSARTWDFIDVLFSISIKYWDNSAAYSQSSCCSATL